MKRSLCSFLVLCFLLTLFFFNGVDACWGKAGPAYGETTNDYDLLVGSDLVVNCSLHRSNLKYVDKRINSSDLIIIKDRQVLSEFTQVIDDYTVQLKIPKATVNDSGLYICKIFLSQRNEITVCGTKITVGYPPYPVKNFSCISINFDNINCTWSTEENRIHTTYTIKKYLMNNLNLAMRCPKTTQLRNSCEWSRITYPMFIPVSRNYTFIIFGNNSLGNSSDTFVIDTFSIVIPNSPVNLTILNVSAQAATVKWNPPRIRSFARFYRLFKYQIWLSNEFTEVTDFEVYEIEDNTTFYLESLIPHVRYNVSVRCRSIFAEKENMWSNFTSLEFRTLADVPYKAPDVIPEAFEIYTYEHSRSVKLHWNVIPKLFYNGELFHYLIKYYHSNHSENYTVLATHNSYITVKNLQYDLPYTFQIHSANEKGISEDYGSIFIASQDKIPPSPKNVRAIAQDFCHYNVTWIPPNKVDAFNYTVFWCPSSTWGDHMLHQCDNKSIYWTNETVVDTNILLYMSDFESSYDFAVVSKSDMGTSSMTWASSVGTVINGTGLSKIKQVYVEERSTTTLRVFWVSKCPADKQHLKSYEITYCGVEKHEECYKVAVKPTANDFLLENLCPNTNYSISIRSISTNNKSSKESDKVYQSTLPGDTGFKKIHNPELKEINEEPENSDKSNPSAILVSATLGTIIFIVVFCLFIVWMKYKNPHINIKSMKLLLEEKSPKTMTPKRENCVVFGRKSSSIPSRIQLSSGSKSETDTDLLIPPSPDSSINGTCLRNSYRNHLSSLTELHV